MTKIAKLYLEALCNVYLDLLLLCPLEHFIELDLSLSELSEDNDLVQPAAGIACEHEPHKAAQQLQHEIQDA